MRMLRSAGTRTRWASRCRAPTTASSDQDCVETEQRRDAIGQVKRADAERRVNPEEGNLDLGAGEDEQLALRRVQHARLEVRGKPRREEKVAVKGKRFGCSCFPSPGDSAGQRAVPCRRARARGCKTQLILGCSTCWCRRSRRCRSCLAAGPGGGGDSGVGAGGGGAEGDAVTPGGDGGAAGGGCAGKAHRTCRASCTCRGERSRPAGADPAPAAAGRAPRRRGLAARGPHS